ncbi:MAG: hypothetical protein H0X39_08150 [Actinobacteria bacterium]|nr:hypothetical protein [Actinomycetota bacterium]
MRAVGERRLGPSARGVSLVALGLGVGALTSVGQTYLDRPWAALTNSAGAWLVAPFVAGALMPSRRGAATIGLITCSFELVGYYATAHARGFSAGGSILVFWAICALIGGPLYGLAGQLWRHGPRVMRGLGGTALPAVFLAEGLWVYHHQLHYEITAVLWGVIAAALLVLSWRPVHLRWFPLTLGACLFAEVVLSAAYSQSF